MPPGTCSGAGACRNAVRSAPSLAVRRWRAISGAVWCQLPGLEQAMVATLEVTSHVPSIRIGGGGARATRSIRCAIVPTLQRGLGL